MCRVEEKLRHQLQVLIKVYETGKTIILKTECMVAPTRARAQQLLVWELHTSKQIYNQITRTESRKSSVDCQDPAAPRARAPPKHPAESCAERAETSNRVSVNSPLRGSVHVSSGFCCFLLGFILTQLAGKKFCRAREVSHAAHRAGLDRETQQVELTPPC